MPTATQGTSEYDINQLNLTMRQQPWYQNWFRARGLNPNQVRLSDGQRQELTAVANQNGYQLGDRMKIDQAGNINQMGGFAGMPTWAKIAISAAPIAATAGFGAAGMGPMAGMLGGGGGVGAAGTGTGLAAAQGAAQGMSPILMGTGGLSGMAGTGATLAGLTGAPIAAANSIPTAGSTFGGINLAQPSVSNMFSMNSLAKAAQPGSNIWDYFLGRGTQDVADIGSLFGSLGEAEANNRANTSRTAYSQGQLALNAQQDRRAQEADALNKLSQTSYIKSGGVPYDASQVKLAGGRALPSFNFPRAPISDEMKQGASDLETQLLNRMKPEGSYTPPPYTDFTKRGTMEQIGNYGGMIGSGIGMAKKLGVLDDIGRGVGRVGKTVWDLFT